MSDSLERQPEVTTEHDPDVENAQSPSDNQKAESKWDFVSPSDAMMSPCTAQVLKKNRMRGRGVPRSIAGSKLAGKDKCEVPTKQSPLAADGKENKMTS
jgi:hypothetical protein